MGAAAGKEALVRGANLGNVLALGELVRKRLDPRVPDAPQLVPPVAENVGELGFIGHA